MASRIILGVLFLIAVLWSCTFRVFEQERAVLFQLGEIKRADFTPGLHFLIPVYQNVRKFDGRLQTLDSEPQRFLTGEKKDVIVDSFVRWRIKDVVKFYLSTGGDPRRAGLLVYQKINDALRVEFGKRKVQEVVAGQRGAILDIVNAKAAERGQELGIEVVDVRVKRIDLPAEVSNAVYERMRAERARVARELRARGEKEAIRIRADTDYEVTRELIVRVRPRELKRVVEFYAAHELINDTDAALEFEVDCSAEVMRSATSCPTSAGSPAKFTTRLFSVRPASSAGSLRDGPSTSTRCRLPTIEAEIRRACASVAACSRCSRSSLRAAGVSSLRSAAGVPGRGL
jgi:membrane protease subunit HflC